MLRGSAAAVLAITLLGCPPPAYLEIFNNTSAEILVLTRGGSRHIEPGESLKDEMRDLVYFRPAGDGSSAPVLAIQADSIIWEYDTFQTRESPFLELYGSIATWKLQVESDGALLVLRPEDVSPVASSYPQPDGFPAMPSTREVLRPAA